MSNWLTLFQPDDVAQWQQTRAGETRLGQSLPWLNPLLPFHEALVHAAGRGAKFAIVGIPEDIGPRANGGQGGAHQGYAAFLSRFVNLQENDFIRANQIVVVGQVQVDDLQQQASTLSASDEVQLAQLRTLCAELDKRVVSVLQPLFEHGFIPIVIGGGHNNALPILQALAMHSGMPADAINLDPHCDFRLLEGRHSGNGFSYAHQSGWLRRYYVVGLHEQKNSQAALSMLKSAHAGFTSFQQLVQRRAIDWPHALEQALAFVGDEVARPLGIELDTDAITGMPASAITHSGVSVADAEHYVWRLAQSPRVRYLHLAEAAPQMHPAGLAAGTNMAGQVLCSLVLAFIQSLQSADVGVG